MNSYLTQVSAAARNAAFKRDWVTVDACAREILKHDATSAEGHFLNGLAAKAAQSPAAAVAAFSTALEIDEQRYDAAIELANQYCAAQRHADAAALVSSYEDRLASSPLYLHMAATVYSTVGMHDRAWPLFQRADELQPGVPLFEAHLATCATFLGKIPEARRIYARLLQREPGHQRYHYQLAKLGRATDSTHIQQMEDVLAASNLSPDKNVFMYYALGKELEDLGQWDRAFDYFRKAGDAVLSVAAYDIDADIALIDKIIEVCDAGWIGTGAARRAGPRAGKSPIFIVGLPRSGTTLVERIVSSHSEVASVGETQYMQMVIRRESGIDSEQKMTPSMIAAAAELDASRIGDGYMDMLEYRLGAEARFVDKLPFNILYLGFIVKAFPDARIVLVERNPMDCCFAMYKQVFTWAYKFSYSLEGLSRFYVAYRRLLAHWRRVIGDRLIQVEYESLVADQEGQTRTLLDNLGLPFEAACLDFDKNRSASATASSVQVREKIHARSVGRWKNYEKHLQPLKQSLESAGIAVD
jgi:tetratricopeptide (TPR) repeat protein